MMTAYRKAEHDALAGRMLSGQIIDLGGHANSPYRALFDGIFSVTTVNLSPDADIRCDFEQPLPIGDAAYDGALLINVLEHIFEYRQLVAECARVLRPGSPVIIAVPFLFPYHPSPNDFHRYTSTALERTLTAAGFVDIRITPLGSGVCMVRWALLERLIPGPLRAISLVATPIASLCDRVLAGLARACGKKYAPSDYPLGFVVEARKR